VLSILAQLHHVARNPTVDSPALFSRSREDGSFSGANLIEQVVHCHTGGVIWA
jgi:hypothetical protein